ncbi:glycosyl hydrolase 115 family protein [Pedobacter alpinus]|uniref:Glycosyl hydrolase 115 family protein n=1 Tax=Pedobacter alpinus TaxID=1590643 RepID=A0ABW5TW15_9SPHI
MSPQHKITLVYHRNSAKLDSILAHTLAKDIFTITGYQPQVLNSLAQAKGNIIVLENADELSYFKQSNASQIRNQWEVFSIKTLQKPNAKINKALIITGSDNRGLAYGVFHLSEKLGINPWYYWADVHTEKKSTLSIAIKDTISKTPSVKYRGVFLNDEDWGLRPWAATQIDKELNNIGPKTYAKIFELLLRLKANMIWPAMHPGTKAFFNVPGNLEMAQHYNIIISTSHAEPMLRNNVDEWSEQTMGRFNYLTNKEKIQDYWKNRILESKKNEVIYTMGMRGVHDSGMEGVKSNKEAVPLTEQVIKDQRQILADVLGKNSIPQAITLYKEVLDIYDLGLIVPDDVTLVWPDDNYGYIRRLNSPEEAKRTGGSGVYYHASYWGRPHDYLWLSTIPAGLMWKEMLKAYQNNSKKIWVLNVGDIKPAEYQTQLFMDMAYDISPFQNNNYLIQHRKNWYESIFPNQGNSIANLMNDYEQLALERKPEFMGWSQTEPTTKIAFTAYNHFYYGDEAQQRLNKYQNLENRALRIADKLANQYRDSYFELVKYPVIASSNMSKKFLYRDKAVLYAKQGRLSAIKYKDSTDLAYQNIAKLTQYFNDSLANGKWKNMMFMTPRKLPVFDNPKILLNPVNSKSNWGLITEGQTELDDKLDTLILPNYYESKNQKFFVDIFLTKDSALHWELFADKAGLKFSVKAGHLSKEGKTQERIWISLEDNFVFETKQEILLTIKTSFGTKYIKINVLNHTNSTTDKLVFQEMNGYISIYAENYTEIKSSKNKYWHLINGLGYTQKIMESVMKGHSQDDAVLSYQFINTSLAKPIVSVFTVPNHPLNKNYSLKYAISVDNGDWIIKDFATKDRNNEWKQNVLSNISIQKITLPELKPGKHILQFKMIDPGVMLDRMILDFGGFKPAYSTIAETK